MPELGFFSNPWLLGAVVCSALLQVLVMMIPVTQRILGVSAGMSGEWILIFAGALIPVTVVEILKLIVSFWRPRPTTDVIAGLTLPENR
jgi:Ca2+-transporting ATPase